MLGRQHSLGHKHTPEQIRAQSLRMMGHNMNASRRRALTATKGNKIWKFESTMQAAA